MYWRCKECKRYIPDGMSHECTPKPKRSELLTKIRELQAKSQADLNSCNKEWQEIFHQAQARINELESQLQVFRIKDNRFYLEVGGDYVCGICKWQERTIDEMKKHIWEKH